MTLACRRILAPFALLAVLVPIASSAEPRRPAVPGFERFHSEAGSDAVAGGLLLLGELNCTSCHRSDAGQDAQLLKKQAPVLDAVGSRVKPGFLRAFLAGPSAAKPGTTMPDVLGRLEGQERADAVEALVHFLASTGAPSDSAVDRRAIDAGRALYEHVGCLACHGPREGDSAPLATSAPLPDLAAKYTVGSLRAFLADPHQARPSGRMPSLNLQGDEAFALANYLLKDSKAQGRPNFAFRAYEGDWEKLPDLDTLQPVKQGESIGLDLSLASRVNNSALRFEGFLHLDRDDRYTFHVTSDDGAKLWIDDKLVVDNDGIHPPQTSSKSVRLARGTHKVVVGFFNGGAGADLSVDLETRNVGRRSIEPMVSLREQRPKEETDPKDQLTPDPELAKKGRELFASIGCASCHQLVKDGKKIESTLTTAGLATLKIDSGCLAPNPTKSSANYSLDDRQRAAIGSALGALARAPAPPDVPTTISRTMTAFNCYACHQRGGIGGVEEARRASFQTTYQDLGDEGTIPPHLNGVGGKLTAEWLAHVLNDGAKDRPYMLTRMPKFGGGNVGGLAKAFETADPLAPVPPVELSQPEKKIKATGRHLVGTQAFGCVQCHNFRGIKSQGIPALDLTIMTRRLRHDWFVPYVINPQAYRPGTRMPSSWPNPESALPDILDGDSRKQIEAVWQYLSDGDRATVPFGIGRSPIPLIAEKEAVIYRAFIEGAGTRGIGVGYPEGANLAFDANQGRIALIWQGGFMDASKHWTGRGEGFQPPMGDNIVAMADGPSFATLKSETEPWPSFLAKFNGFRFRGYRLSKERRPTFLYEVGPVKVEDTPDAVKPSSAKESASLKRTIALTAPGGARISTSAPPPGTRSRPNPTVPTS